MKVLHINPYPPEHQGGSEIFCRSLAIKLKKDWDIDCDILTSDIFRKNEKIRYIGNNSIKVYYKKFIINLWGKNPIVNIYHFLKKNYLNYDLIHIHSYIFFSSIQCSILRKFKKFPLILHIHGGVQTQNFFNLKFLEKIQLAFKEKIFDKYVGRIPIEEADAIISVSDKDLSIIKEKYNVDDQYCFHIPIGIDINKFKPDNNLKREFITFIGRLSYVKGFDIFLKIIKILHKKDPNLKFLVIGDGQLKSSLIQAKKKLPIKYIPSYSYKKMENVYNRSKILLITSRFEGLPTIMLESLSCKTPVVSTDIGGISEVISNNKNGIIFNTLEYRDVIDLILDLVKNKSDLEQFGIEGRKIILKEFSWQKVTQKIVNVYKLVLHKKNNL